MDDFKKENKYTYFEKDVWTNIGISFFWLLTAIGNYFMRNVFIILVALSFATFFGMKAYFKYKQWKLNLKLLQDKAEELDRIKAEKAQKEQEMKSLNFFHKNK